MTSLANINQFLSQGHFALAGVSRQGKKFGNLVLKELVGKGYRISVVHPTAGVVDGVKCHPSLDDLPEKVGGLIVAIAPEQAKGLVRDAVAAGVHNIWLQKGAESAETLEFCQCHGINVIHGECILMFARPAGIHRFHRWLWGVLGRLSQGYA